MQRPEAGSSTPTIGVTDGPALVVDGVLRLIGGRCTRCGSVQFPASPDCSSCGACETDEHPLQTTGSLWSWTVQTFPPVAPPFEGDPDGFEPFGVGYVDLGDVLVEARLTVADPEELRIGMPMALTIVEFAPGRWTFAFTPSPEAAA